MTGSQNRSAALTVPSSCFGSAPAFIDVGHAARRPCPASEARTTAPHPLTRTSRIKGTGNVNGPGSEPGSEVSEIRHRRTKASPADPQALTNELEQPAPAHRPWPAPKLPSLLARGDGEEDDLGAPDQILQRHEADRRFHAAIGGIVAVVAHHEIVAGRDLIFL